MEEKAHRVNIAVALTQERAPKPTVLPRTSGHFGIYGDGPAISLPVNATPAESRYVDDLTRWQDALIGGYDALGKGPNATQLAKYRVTWENVRDERARLKNAPERYKIADDWLVKGLKALERSVRLYRRGKKNQADLEIELAYDCFTGSGESLNNSLRAF